MNTKFSKMISGGAMKHWIIGFIAGSISVALIGLALVWFYRLEVLNLVSHLYGQRVVGETKILQQDGLLYQDGKEVGNLKRGTLLLHRLQTESLEEFYLPIGWENKGEITQYFGQVGQSKRAFVILATPK